LAQETQPQAERQIITLNGKDYFVDSFPEEEKAALVQIEQVLLEIEKKKMEIRNLEYAKGYLVDYLAKNADKFEEAPKPEKSE
jgi:hypothetical protein